MLNNTIQLNSFVFFFILGINTSCLNVIMYYHIQIYIHTILEMSPAPAVLTLHKVWCYPIQFVTPAPRLPPVEYMADKEQTYVRFNGERLLINTLYLQKLVRDVMIKSIL